jgi:hypothetical protein
MKYILMAVYQVCSNKSPCFKIGIGPGAFIQVSDFRAIMALLFLLEPCETPPFQMHVLYIYYRDTVYEGSIVICNINIKGVWWGFKLYNTA